MGSEVLPLLVVLSVWANTLSAQNNNGFEIFGGGTSQCPNLPVVAPYNIREIYSAGPLYVTFVPVSPINLALDNICYYATSLPDNANTFLLSVSRVYTNGRNQIESYVVSQPQTGVTRYGSSECLFVDIPFAYVRIQGCGTCDIVLIYRCVLGGDCGSDFDVVPPIFGMSYNPRPISVACIQKAKDTIRSFGFPDQDYITYPMRLPTKCVFGTFSYSSSIGNRFKSLIGLY